MTRQSPAESATQYGVGIKKKGLDGKMWIIVVNKNGVKRWTRHGTSKVEKVTKTVPSQKRKVHHILFCDPSAPIFNPKPGHEFVKYATWAAFEFEMDDDMYKKLGTWKMYGGLYKNAYVFGKKYPIDKYVLLGDHLTDMAQTGFVDLDMLDERKKEFKRINVLDIVLKCYKQPGKKTYFPWDNKPSFKKVHDTLPFILFVGRAASMNASANLYGHYSGKKLDGLIISPA